MGRSSIENEKNILLALNGFGFGSLKITEQDFKSDDLILQFGYSPLRIDVLTGISGVNFADCYLRKKRTKLDGVWINLIHFNDLKKNKKATGRAEDLYDVKKLEQIELNAKKKSKNKKHKK